MKSIFKYELKVTDIQRIEMPKDAKILCVQVQKGTLCLWAEVDRDAKTEARRIAVYGTGHTMMIDEHKYIGSFQLYGGDFVGHVYEVV